MLNRIITVVLVLSVFAFSVESIASISVPAPDDQKNEINEIKMYTDEDTSIIVTPDQPQFNIKLKSNPTTGYSWFLREYDSSLIQAVSNKYHAPLQQLVGASGFEVWTFKVNPAAFTVPHQTTIRMQYARPWNKTDSGTQVVFHIATQLKKDE